MVYMDVMNDDMPFRQSPEFAMGAIQIEAVD